MVFATENLGNAIALCLGLASRAKCLSCHAQIHAADTAYVHTSLDIVHVILPGAELIVLFHVLAALTNATVMDNAT